MELYRQGVGGGVGTDERQGNSPGHSVHHISTSTVMRYKAELPNRLNHVRPLRRPTIGKLVNNEL
jgi:hypothetical protein